MSRFGGGDQDQELIANMGMEMHALSSAVKPFCSWTARDAIQDCRESCGGHGYLKSTYKHLRMRHLISALYV